MATIWTSIKAGGLFIAKNWSWIITAIAVVLVFLLIEQCKSVRIAKRQTQEAVLIAENNRKALNDSTIILKLTRNQLKETDKNLSKVVADLEALKKNPKIVYVARPEYIPKDVVASNSLITDPIDSTRYGLKFDSFDSVRTIGATSWFYAYNTPTQLKITPDKTIIDEFSLNFGLAIAQYDDKKEKVTRLSITPYYIGEDGTYTQPISSELLHMHYRGVELLNVPYAENTNANEPPKSKYSVRSGFALQVGIVNYGMTPFTEPSGLNFMVPSIGIGYSIVLIKNR